MRLMISESVSILVYADRPWNDLDIEVYHGERYQFESIGNWWDFLKKTDADGYTNIYMRLFDARKRAPAHPWFALIGSIDQTHDFLIGKSREITMLQSGRLSCYANDIKGFYWNNSGVLGVRVERRS